MATLTSVTKHFPKPKEGFITTLSSTISSGATTVPLTSVSGLTNGDVFVGLVEPGLTNEQCFTGTVDTAGTQITNVVWTKGTNVGHNAGSTVVDYVTSTTVGMISKGILVEHNQDGTHSDITATSLSVTANIDVNDSSTAIRDTSDNELVKFAKTASAVNELTITNAATTGTPQITATGGDTNIYAGLYGKGNAATLIQTPRQDNTTNTYPTEMFIQSGWGFINGDGTNRNLQENVTFPIAFSSAPIVVCTAIGYKNAADPTGPGDTIGVATINFAARSYDVSASAASIQITRSSTDGADPGVLASGTRFMYSWIAIGPK